MLYRPLGRTGLTVSEIGFGCASFWGKPIFDERRAMDLVHAALDQGVTLFDTAASYSHGEAEPRLGRALKGRDASRLVVATKAGTRAEGRTIVRDVSPAGVVASAERSLRNLGLDVLPVLQLHGPAAAELTDDLLAALSRLRERGLVRALGVNSFDPAVIEHAISLPLFDLVMIDYNVLRPEREPLIARAAANGKAVLAGMPLAMGHVDLQILKLRGLQDLWYAARGFGLHRREMALGARMSGALQAPGLTRAQAALAYVLANADVSCAVVGATRLRHLGDNTAASGARLPDETLARIRREQATILERP
jgi:aryl-alcohol dehydrogenase-like predicted oxidoreductase